MEICVVTLIGLPGSGKSTLCKTIKDFLEMSDTGNVSFVIPVCYDELIPVEFLLQDDSLSWKNARKDVLKYVSQLLRCLKGLDECNKLDLKTKEKLLDIINCSGPCRVFVLIDDNMYYRSMRYEYYQLARLYSLSFCQVYVETCVTDAMSRNSRRDPKLIVPEEIILRMSEKLEPPNVCNSWEKMSLTVAAESWTAEEIGQFLNDACKHSVAALVDNSEARAESRAICSASVVHQVDVVLRKLVGERMRQSRESGMSSEQLETCSKLLADVRRRVMEGIKSGRLDVPEDVQKLIEQQHTEGRSKLHSFLDDLFDLHKF